MSNLLFDNLLGSITPNQTNGNSGLGINQSPQMNWGGNSYGNNNFGFNTMPGGNSNPVGSFGNQGPYNNSSFNNPVMTNNPGYMFGSNQSNALGNYAMGQQFQTSQPQPQNKMGNPFDLSDLGENLNDKKKQQQNQKSKFYGANYNALGPFDDLMF
jgi:hypothetical protein